MAIKMTPNPSNHSIIGREHISMALRGALTNVIEGAEILTPAAGPGRRSASWSL